MKLFSAVLTFLIASTATAIAKGEVLWVHLPPTTTQQDEIFLTGSRVCNWNPTCLPAQTVQAGLVRFEIPEGWRWSEEPQTMFKITRGTWDREAADRTGNRWSNQVWPLGQGEHEVRIDSWSDRGGLGEYASVETHQVNCAQLGRSLVLKVWHPNLNSLVRSSGLRPSLDLIYAYDGQNAFDPNGNMTGYDWAFDDILRAEGRNAPIVIGMESGPNRRQEYDLNSSIGRAHFQCLRDQILARFETRLAQEKSFQVRRRYVVGSSMGALAALATAWNLPDLFKGAAGMSLPAFVGNGLYFDLFRSANSTQRNLRIYFDHGDQGQDATYSPSNERFLRRLQDLGVQNTHYQVFKRTDHSEFYWASRLQATLNWLRQP